MQELRLIQYTAKEVSDTFITDLTILSEPRLPNQAYWYDIVKATDTEIEELALIFDWHHLLVENILHKRKMPSIEEFENCLFVCTKMLVPNGDQTEYEHVSFILGDNYLFSFQERQGDVFEEIRQRILQDKGRVRKRNSDFLMARLLTAIVKNYQLELDYLRDTIEDLESQLMQDLADDLPTILVRIRKKTAKLRRIVRMQEEAINDLEEDGSKFINSKTMAYILHLQDVLQQLTSTFDVFRDMLASLMDLHLANLSQNMNVVMKMLTIVSTVFIPLTFLAGIYGMNFEHMPELSWQWAYPTLLGVMVATTIGIVIFLQRRKWM